MLPSFYHKLCFFIFIYIASLSLYGQEYREIMLSVTDSASSSTANYISASAFPSNTLNDLFDYKPHDATSTTPQLSYTDADALHFNGTTDAWVEYTLMTPTSLGNNLSFFFDFWGRDDFTSRDDDFDIELYDETGTLFHTITAGVKDEVNFYSRYAVSSSDIDLNTVLSSFIVRSTDVSNSAFTLMEVRMGIEYNIITEDTVYVCSGSPYEITTTTNADAFLWTSEESDDLVYLDAVDQANINFQNTSYLADTMTYVVQTTFESTTYNDTIVIITTLGAIIDSLDVSSLCTGGDVTLFSNLSTGITWDYDIAGATLVAENEDSITLSPLVSQYYTVSSTGTEGEVCYDSVLVDPSGGIGDPSVLGDGQWISYVYDNEDFTSYLGYYTIDDMSFDTKDDWDETKTPSEASNYVGCIPSADDNFSVSTKRKGFDCGYYQLDLWLSHGSDVVQVYIDGTLVYQQTNANTSLQTYTNVWTGVLNESSEVEIKHVDVLEDHSLEVSFVALEANPLITTPSTDTLYLCTNSSFSIEADTTNFGGRYTWFSSTGHEASLNSLTESSVSFTPTGTEETAKVEFQMVCGDSTFRDTLTIITLEKLEIDDIDATSICSGGDQVVLSASLSKGISWYPTNDIDASTDNSITVSPATNQYYTVTSDRLMGSCATSDSVYIDVTSGTVGDTATFGDYEWREYFYGNGSQNLEHYFGYASFGDSNTYDFNTQDYWDPIGDPAFSAYDADYYVGCPSTNSDTWNTVYKRRGFKCGNYQIDMFADDFVDVYVDGKLVATNNSTITNVENVWTGILKEDSEIEIRLQELLVHGRITISFVPVTQLGDEQIELFTSPTVDDFYVCTGGTEYPIVVREEGYTWNVAAGTNNINRFSANGDTAYYISPASGNADTVTYVVTSDGCGDGFQFFDSLTVISSDTALTKIIDVEGDSACTSGGVSLGSVNLIATGANSYVWTDDATNTLASYEGGTVVATPSTETNYIVTGTIEGSTCTAGKVSISDEVEVGVFDLSEGAPGDTSVFGENTWIAYYFDELDYENYYGYFNPLQASSSVIGFNTPDDFWIEDNPTDNVHDQYFGCTSGSDDGFSLMYKRKGFPCGYYSITFDVLGADSDLLAEVYIDGVQVISSTEQYITGAQNYYLTEESEVTVKTEEGVGNILTRFTLTETSLGNVILGRLDNGNGDLSIWHGQAGDNDWNNSANWCYSSMPSDSKDAYITATGQGVTDYPIITGTTAQTRSLYNYGEFSINAGDFKVSQSIENDGVFTVTDGGITFNGTLDGEISGNNIAFDDITLTKTNPDDTIVLANATTLSGTLDLTKGQLHTSSTNTLTLLDGSSVVNASTDAFIDGPLTKIGDADFEFPVGKDDVYAPVTLSSTTDASTDEVTVEYFYTDPTALSNDHGNIEDDLTRVSVVEYWDIDFGTNVSPSYSISLSWDDTERQSGINDLNSLEMAYHDGTEWLKLEATPLSGATINAGDLQNESSALLTVSGPVTFGTTEESDIFNPLPVSFVRFQAELIQDIPRLTWITSSERNNDYYIIERSEDAINFDSIAYVEGSGTSYQTNYYHYDDDTYKQGSTCYYRIRQIDFDGSSTVSKTVSVSANLRTVTNEAAAEVEVFPNPLTAGNLTIQYPEESGKQIYHLSIKNYLGLSVVSREVNDSGVVIEELAYLPNGIYFLHIETSEGTKVTKLVKSE